MPFVYPNYYDTFSCIKGACKHNCCIGWEIDIDEDSLSFYNSLDTPLGERLQAQISKEAPAHFILCKQERCPFLNKENLCDLIIELGEERLCTICKEHPRFYNQLPDRTEVGLGLCCEAAGRLILSQKEPMRLLCAEHLSTTDEMLLLRDEILSILQDRSTSLFARMKQASSLLDISEKGLANKEFARKLLALERMDEQWTRVLRFYLDSSQDEQALKSFGVYLDHCNRTQECEQFAVYLLYRHFSNVLDEKEAGAYLAFIKQSCEMLYEIAAAVYSTKGCFTFEDHVELCRLFSSEIEYSEENMSLILDDLYELLFFE